jgi:hypothetical protein
LPLPPQVLPPFTFIAHRGFSRPSTRIYVRLLGPCFKTGRGQAFRQASCKHLHLSRRRGTERLSCERLAPLAPPAADFPRHQLMLTETHPRARRVLPAAASLLAISSPLHSLFKVLFIFPSRYLFAIGLLLIFSFRWNLPPTLSCTRKQLDSLEAGRSPLPLGPDGAGTLSGLPFNGSCPSSSVVASLL